MILSMPLRHAFVPRFTPATAAEFDALSSLLEDVELTDEADIRRCP